jgi:hypothetical protein
MFFIGPENKTSRENKHQQGSRDQKNNSFQHIILHARSATIGGGSSYLRLCQWSLITFIIFPLKNATS